MLMKMVRPAIALLALTTYGIGHAADMAIDCKLKGGTVVQLPAGACRMEGGMQVIEATPAVPAAVSEPADGGATGNQAPAAPKLAEAQKVIVDLLGKPVMETTSLDRNPEGIRRLARFDGCRLIADEDLHIEYGNAFSVWKNFRVSSVVDFRKIGLDAFGVLGKIASKGGELRAAAVYVEQRKRKEGNSISISVLEQKKEGGYEKFVSYGLSPYWDAPQYDLWMTDEYGYVKSDGWGRGATDRIRMLFIVASQDDAEKLNNALEEVSAICTAIRPDGE